LLPRLARRGWVVVAPTQGEVDLLDAGALERALEAAEPDLVLHLAAFTNVALAEVEREACWAANVVGTRNLARLAPARLVHLSTDYVFDGERGAYREGDAPNPSNYYSLTKLVGEEAARGARDHLVVRTSFKESVWPHPVAFTDQFTSADYVDVIAGELELLLLNHERVRPADCTLHVATERKSVFELASRRNPGVLPGSRQEARVHIPPDVSLDVGRWEGLKREIGSLAPGVGV
jgi:dTDP-4-dehydrorhamnose reductase